MSEDEMARKVRDAAQKGLYLDLKEGTDAQIMGRFLDVRVKLTKDSIHGEYLGWCSLSRRAELEQIMRDHSPNSWRRRIEANKPTDTAIADEIGLLLRQFQNLEADRASMDPEHASAQLSSLRKQIERLHERALTRSAP